MAERVLAEAAEQEDPYLLKQISAALRSPAAQSEKSLAVLAVTAAEANLKLAGDKDLPALLAVAESQNAVGNTEKGKEFGMRAVAVAEGVVAAEGEKKKPMTLIRLAEAYMAVGDTAKAREVRSKPWTTRQRGHEMPDSTHGREVRPGREVRQGQVVCARRRGQCSGPRVRDCSQTERRYFAGSRLARRRNRRTANAAAADPTRTKVPGSGTALMTDPPKMFDTMSGPICESVRTVE